MARKHLIYSFPMFDGQSLGASANSAITNVAQLDKCSIHVVWSGTSVNGTLAVQARNGGDNPWFSLDFGGPITLSTDSGEHLIVLNEMPFTDVRLAYTRTTGTGTIDAVITAKTVGG